MSRIVSTIFASILLLALAFCLVAASSSSVATASTSNGPDNNNNSRGDSSGTMAFSRKDRQLQGEELICFNGFVMDVFCINRGTLLDNPSVTTLEEPDRHSVHCLVDVSRCFNSGYELLMDPQEEGELYGRAFQLDETGNTLVLSMARAVGTSCSTCDGTGTLSSGFRATVTGIIDTESTAMPPRLKVLELRGDDEPCTEAEGGQYIPSNITFASGSGGGSGGIDSIALHGGLMATAWGFLLPLGVLSSRFLRHRPGGLWFILHRTLNLSGVALTIIGIIVAFVSFDNVFSDGMGPSYNHGVMGLTTMCLGILQALNGIARPHAPKEEDASKKETKRLVWEVLHKTTGYATIALAYATIYYGAQVAGSNKKNVFMGVFYATFCFAVIVAFAMIGDKLLFSNTTTTKTTTAAADENVANDDAEEGPTTSAANDGFQKDDME